MSQQKYRLPVQGVKKEEDSVEAWDDVESMFHPPQHDFRKGSIDGDDRMSDKVYEGEHNTDVKLGASFEAGYENVRQAYHRLIDAAVETHSTGAKINDALVDDQDAFSIKFSLSQEYKDDASFAEYCAMEPCQTMSSFQDHSLFPSPLPLHGTDTFDFGENGSPLPMLQLSTTPSPPRGTNKLDSTTSDLTDDMKLSPHDPITIGNHYNKLHPRKYHMDLVQSNSSDDFSPPREKYHSLTTPIPAVRPVQHQSPGQTIYNIASTSVDSPQSPYHPIPWREASRRHPPKTAGPSAVGRGVSPSESQEVINTTPEFYPPRGYMRGQNRSVHETTITVTDNRNGTHCSVSVDPITPSPSQIRQAVSDESVSPTLAPTVHHPPRHSVAPTSSGGWTSTPPSVQSHQAPWNGQHLPPALPSSGPVYHHTSSSSSPYHHLKHGALEERKITDPNHLGEEAHWRKHQHLLHQFLLHFGHCNVPPGYGVGTHYEGLYQWCINQRTEYQKMCRGKVSGEKSSMTPERVRILTGMGFVWGHSLSTFRQSAVTSISCGNDTNAASSTYSSWDRWMELLSDYKKQYGDVDVPLKYEPNLSLGTFVQRQRTEYRKMQNGKPSSLTPERVDELNRLGFTWTVRDNQSSWEDRYNELKEFKKMSGHCNVPKVYTKNPSLGYWVNEQRFQYRRKMKGQSSYMTDEKVQALNELEFKWSLREANGSWENWIKELRKYKDKHGDIDVPLKYVHNQGLGAFVNRQRTEYRKLQQGLQTSLTKERIQSLNDLGFKWAIRVSRTPWESRLDELKRFKDEHGHCNVPSTYPKNQPLAYWVFKQRGQYRIYMDRGPVVSGESAQICHMTPERIAKLDALGFEWNPPRRIK
ncbi:hypothetical protein ACHAWU_008316 [Discostella pseudostelligera]|uniref:Helicase-associated domain-containing protein n=1 Tax=Discostella pseudostelligera TaxID=259834 RepID=A0ABD3M4H5_9STRA